MTEIIHTFIEIFAIFRIHLCIGFLIAATYALANKKTGDV
jgi:hypothetical protein